MSLNDRDSKIHVTDYNLDGIKLLYSSAEILTWARGPGSTRVLILYGGAGETHELAVARQLGNMTVVGRRWHHIQIQGLIAGDTMASQVQSPLHSHVTSLGASTLAK